jgi:hypothetical protein
VQVVVEFQKGNERGRTIKLKHSPAVLPPQLHGRVAHEAWAALVNDCLMLAKTHPYVARPGAGRVASWAGGMLMGAVVGFCCINPDGGCSCHLMCRASDSLLAPLRCCYCAHRRALARSDDLPSLRLAAGARLKAGPQGPRRRMR